MAVVVTYVENKFLRTVVAIIWMKVGLWIRLLFSYLLSDRCMRVPTVHIGASAFAAQILARWAADHDTTDNMIAGPGSGADDAYRSCQKYCHDDFAGSTQLTLTAMQILASLLWEHVTEQCVLSFEFFRFY